MNQITFDNCAKYCTEQFCSGKREYYEILEIHGLKVFISLCERHMIIWMEGKRK